MRLIAILLLAMTVAGQAQAQSQQLLDRCVSKDDPDDAISVCTRILSYRNLSSYNRAAAYNNRGRSYADKQQYPRAIKDYTQSIELDPKQEEAYFNRAQIYLYHMDDKDSDYEKAVSDLTKAIRFSKGKKRAEAYVDRGRAYRWLEEYTKALADCDDSHAVPEIRNEFYYCRGEIRGDIEEYDKAIEEISEAIRLKPDDSGYYNRRGQAWAEKGDYGPAIADFDKAIKLDPKDDESYEVRGEAWEKKGDYDRAIADYSKAIELEPKDEEYRNDRCWARASGNRDMEKALEDCNKALELAPDFGAALDSRGLVYLRLGKFDESIRDYSAAIKNDSTEAHSLFGRGIAKLRKGDTAGGNADIAAAKKIQSDIAEEFSRYGVKAQP